MVVWVGTSGWQYADWRGAFYPPDGPQARWLAHYAARFATVELNASFYRLPERARFAAWAQATPADFVVAVKASRYLTHMKRLLDPVEPVARLLDHAAGLGAKLGPVLVQLPPSFKVDSGRLDAALEQFPPQVRVAVELRDPSWFRPEVEAVLARHGAALCLADRGSRWLTPRWRTADWSYVRFHWGGGRPGPCYPAEVLAARVAELAPALGASGDAFVYFNNDPLGCAPRDAAVFAGACAEAGLPATRTPDLSEVHLRPERPATAG